MSVRILIGDCRERLRELPDNSVDSVVCDPPYHLTSIVKRFGSSTAAPINNADEKNGRNGPYHRAAKGFMGQTWDGGDVAFQLETWAEILRVLKPGGHLVAFSGTRTVHRMVCAIEDAGFEIRDSIAWIYGSGFPKSHDVSKGIDKMAGAEREVLGYKPHLGRKSGDASHESWVKNGISSGADYCTNPKTLGIGMLTAPATDDAREWQGWGTALKPALEPICLARKPLSEKNIAANVLRWGTGAINVDGCRVGTADDLNGGTYSGSDAKETAPGWRMANAKREFAQPIGRWPANLVHDGSDEVLAGFPETASGSIAAHHVRTTSKTKNCFGERAAPAEVTQGDSGSAARFFYTAKTSSAERGEGNNHPTVKPIALMQWLVRLVTPPGGIVLDPFMGSGSTGLACQAELLNFIGCEMSPEYAAIAERRLRDDAGLFADVEAA